MEVLVVNWKQVLGDRLIMGVEFNGLLEWLRRKCRENDRIDASKIRWQRQWCSLL